MITKPTTNCCPFFAISSQLMHPAGKDVTCIMGRCNACASCVAVIEFRSQHTGRRNTKRVKKFETLNKCTDPTAQNKKRRISELDSLYSAGHGGEVRGEISAVLSLEEVSLESEACAACPK